MVTLVMGWQRDRDGVKSRGGCDSPIPRGRQQRWVVASTLALVGLVLAPRLALAQGAGSFDPLPGTPAPPPEPAPDAAPASAPEASPTPTARPLPPSRVLDAYPYLDPDPNPLRIQTQPDEVTIIGTQPLSLEDVLELAFRNNPDVRIAQLELDRSRAALREAAAARLPRVTAGAGLQGQNSRVPTVGPTGPSQAEELALSANGQIDVTYNVFDGGQREATLQAVREQVRLGELELERRRAALRLVTTNEYYELQRATEQITISQAFLTEASRNLRDTQLREQVGVGTRFDVLRAEVQVANARQQLVQAQSDRLVAQRQLARRLNLPPSIDIAPTQVAIAGDWPLSLEESIVLAYRQRAELEQQLVQRQISEQQRRAALGALAPQVDLFANYGFQNNFNRGGQWVTNYTLGARVNWTIFEGGAAQARADQRALDGAIADRRFEETRGAIRLEVEQAFFSLEANQQNISTARLALEQAREALRLARLRFEAGVGTQLEVITAQSALTEAEVNLVQAILGYNRALAALERAVSNLPARYYQGLGF